jgi:hypothetical protein
MPCVSFFLFSAGCETTAKTRVETETINRVLNSTVKTNLTNISNLNVNLNNLRIENGTTGRFECGKGGFNVKTKIEAETVVYNNVSSEQGEDIKNQLVNEMKQQIETMAKDQRGLFESIFGKALNTTSETEVINRLSNEFNNVVSSTNIANVLNSTLNTNEAVIVNNGVIAGDNCTIDEGIVSRLQAQNLVKSIQTSLLSNETFQKIEQEIKTVAESKSSSWLLILLIILGLLALAGGAWWFFGRKKSAALETTESYVYAPVPGVQQTAQIPLAAVAPSPAPAAAVGVPVQLQAQPQPAPVAVPTQYYYY